MRIIKVSVVTFSFALSYKEPIEMQEENNLTEERAYSTLKHWS